MDEAFTTVAELAYEHHLKTTEDILKASKMGEAVNLSAIRSNNFKLQGTQGMAGQDNNASKASKGCCGGGQAASH